MPPRHPHPAPRYSAPPGASDGSSSESPVEGRPCGSPRCGGAGALVARAAEAACLAAEGDASEPVRLVHFSLWSRAPASGPPLSFRARVLSSDGPWVTVEAVGFDEANEAVATGTALFDRPARYPAQCPGGGRP